MKDFEFYNPTRVLFGRDTVSKLGGEMRKAGIKKVLFLYGGGSIKQTGLYDRVVEILEQNNISWDEVGGVRVNPVLSKVHVTIHVAREGKVEAILAVGGGSVIDSAKAIAAGFFYNGDIWDAFIGKCVIREALPIFTILTVSGSASEMNKGAVILNDVLGKKYSFGSFHTYPRVSVIDPTIQFTVPTEQTVYGAIDSMAHIFEQYFDGSDVCVQDRISEALLKTIMEVTEVLIDRPDDYSARANLVWCATLAQNGLMAVGRNGGDWVCHWMGHSLSALYPTLAHGATLAIIFPAWMKHMYREKPEKFERFAKQVFGVKERGEEAILQGIEKLKSWFKQMGAPTTLRDVGIGGNDLEKITNNIMIEGSVPRGTLKVPTREDVVTILRIALE